MTRYIVIGDIHGCAAELRTLLDKVVITPDDIVISLGDLSDKGPDSVDAIRAIKEVSGIIVDSNHDQRYKKYWKKGLSIADVNAKKIKDEYKAEYAKIAAAPDAATYLAGAVPYTEIEVKGQLFTFVHAGVTPYMDIYDLHPRYWGEFLRVRYLNAETHGFIRMVKIDKDKYPDEVASWRPEHDNVIEWQKAYDSRYGIIVHGHIIIGPNPKIWVGEDNHIEVDKRGKEFALDIPLLKEAKAKAISMDTGAHKGWNLTAMIIEEDSGKIYFEQVEVDTCYEP